MARPARQLELAAPLTVLVDLQQERARLIDALMYAREERDAAEATLAQERTACQQVRAEARQVAQHCQEALYRQAALAQENRLLKAQLAAGQAPRSRTPDAALAPILRRLLVLCHPDKWHEKPATELAHEIRVQLNQLRQEVRHGHP